MIAEEEKRLEDRMYNWGRWAMERTGSRRYRCASAEGQYLAPAADEEKLIASAKIPIDERDARFIEQAVISLKHDADRTFVVNLYARGMHRVEMARRQRFDVKKFDDFRLRTLSRLGQRIAAMSEVKLIRRGNAHWAGLAK